MEIFLILVLALNVGVGSLDCQTLQEYNDQQLAQGQHIVLQEYDALYYTTKYEDVLLRVPVDYQCVDGKGQYVELQIAKGE
jgi:hypothetical protein